MNLKAEIKNANRLANNCLKMAEVLYQQPEWLGEDQCAKLMRHMLECACETNSVPEDALLELSVAAGKDFVDLAGNPHRSAHEAAMALGRATLWKIASIGKTEQTGDDPVEMRLKMRLGPDEARQFRERYIDRGQIQREIRLLKHGVEREIATIGADRQSHQSGEKLTTAQAKHDRWLQMNEEQHMSRAAIAKVAKVTPSTVSKGITEAKKRRGDEP